MPDPCGRGYWSLVQYRVRAIRARCPPALEWRRRRPGLVSRARGCGSGNGLESLFRDGLANGGAAGLRLAVSRPAHYPDRVERRRLARRRFEACGPRSPRDSPASALSVCGNSDTRGVPRSTTRFSATTRDRLFCSGDAQRLKSSSRTSFGPVLTTNSGRSTIDGIVTGPTAITRLDGWAGGAAVAVRPACRSATAGSHPAASRGDDDVRREMSAHHLARLLFELAANRHFRVTLEVFEEHAQAARRARELVQRVAQLLRRRRILAEERRIRVLERAIGGGDAPDAAPRVGLGALGTNSVSTRLISASRRSASGPATRGPS